VGTVITAARNTSVAVSDISKLLLSKSEHISFLPGEGKSNVWPHFMRIVVDGVLSYHVMCNDCKSVLFSVTGRILNYGTRS